MLPKSYWGKPVPIRATEEWVGYKTAVLRAWIDKKQTFAQVTAALGLKKAVLYEQRNKVLRGKQLQATAGNVAYLDEAGEQELREIVAKATQNDEGKRSSQYMPELVEIINKSKAARGDGKEVDLVSKSYIKKLEKKGVIDSGGAIEYTTEARGREEGDILNAVSILAAMEAIGKYVPPSLLINTDATTFEIGEGEHTGKVWHVKEEFGKRMVTGKRKSALPMGFKYFAGGSGIGKSMKAVIIAACDSLKPDDCLIWQVPGLAASNSDTDYGWLVLMKTRQPNAKFWDWYAKEVVVEFVKRQREAFRLYEGDDKKKPKWAMWILDGEEAQMRMFDDYRMQAFLRSHNIYVVKLPASTTAIFQPLDVSFLFCNSKRCVAYMVLNWHEQRDMDRILREFLRPYMKDGGKLLKTINGLQKVACALQHVMSRKILQGGFKQIGFVPYKPSTILAQCKVAPSHDEKEAILAALQELGRSFARDGHVTEATYAALGIASHARGDRRQAPKDQRAIQSQRAVLLTHEARIRARQQWLDAHPRGESARRPKKAAQAQKTKGGVKRKRGAGNKAKERTLDEDSEDEQNAPVLNAEEDESDEEEAVAMHDDDDDDDQHGAAGAQPARSSGKRVCIRPSHLDE
jgi:hypothetical protein